MRVEPTRQEGHLRRLKDKDGGGRGAVVGGLARKGGQAQCFSTITMLVDTCVLNQMIIRVIKGSQHSLFNMEYFVILI